MDQFQLHYVDLGVPRIFELHDDVALVGRTDGNDVVLNHPSVSRRHARIESRGGHWWVVDLKSTNGVKVNGIPVAEIEIRQGDKILVGSVELDVKSVAKVDFSEDSPF